MYIKNLTSDTYIFEYGTRLDPVSGLTLSDTTYNNNSIIAKMVNGLYLSSKVSISNAPFGFPRIADVNSSYKLEAFPIAISDESTAITTGTAKITFRMPYAMTLTEVRASLSTASSSGNPAFDVNKNGVSIFSTTLTIDANEKTSTTATTAAVLSTFSLSSDDEITIDIDTAGTGAKGAKITLIGYR